MKYNKREYDEIRAILCKQNFGGCESNIGSNGQQFTNAAVGLMFWLDETAGTLSVESCYDKEWRQVFDAKDWLGHVKRYQPLDLCE